MRCYLWISFFCSLSRSRSLRLFLPLLLRFLLAVVPFFHFVGRTVGRLNVDSTFWFSYAKYTRFEGNSTKLMRNTNREETKREIIAKIRSSQRPRCLCPNMPWTVLAVWASVSVSVVLLLFYSLFNWFKALINPVQTQLITVYWCECVCVLVLCCFATVVSSSVRSLCFGSFVHNLHSKRRKWR